MPKSLKTLERSCGGTLFRSQWVLRRLGVTYVDQEVVRTPDAELIGFSDGREQFCVVDATIGWRFPKRLGIASLTAYNLFDEKFRYQDDSFREFRDDPTTPDPTSRTDGWLGEARSISEVDRALSGRREVPGHLVEKTSELVQADTPQGAAAGRPL